jgi:hypothetical protein
MLEAGKGAAVEQVLFQVPKWAFDFALRFRAAWSAGDGSETIVGGKAQEARVVNRLFAVVAGNDHLHVVVETLGSDTTEMGEGRDVLANRCSEILTLDKMHILAAGAPESGAPLTAAGRSEPCSTRREMEG